LTLYRADCYEEMITGHLTRLVPASLFTFAPEDKDVFRLMWGTRIDSWKISK
jgi:hypothetical protein